MEKTIRIALLTSLSLMGTAYADYNDGVVAYNKGDYKTAFSEWRPYAEKGNADAQFDLGLMYGNGEGVLKDYKRAAKWYRKAADQGHAGAQYNLGRSYFFILAPEFGMIGETVDGVWVGNEEMALDWWKKAADQGLGAAQLQLVLVYGNSLGAKRDRSKAKYWAEKAYGNPDASDIIVEEAKRRWDEMELWKY